MKGKRKKSRPDFATGVGQALRSAAKDAQKIARLHNTPLYYWENGKVVARKPWLSKAARTKSSARKNRI
ncbi:MAG: hypothetical protein WB974_03810 [Acidobacteriaceae bacterium]